MSIDAGQLLDYAVEPTLDELAEAAGSRYEAIRGPSAAIMLLSTAAHESDLGSYIHQVGGGPARSIYQFEPATVKDVFDRVRRQYVSLWNAAVPMLGACDFETNLKEATVAARLIYWLQPGKLPPPRDAAGAAQYWHEYWCRGCAGTIQQFLKARARYVDSLVEARY